MTINEPEASTRPTSLERKLGVNFQDPRLLTEALTHRSYAYENDSPAHNERLEFLGDSVLGLLVTDLIYLRHPSMTEGDMAKLRAGVVNAQILASVAREIDLGSHLLLGKGEEMSGGRDKSSLLSDVFEAVLGAVYLDAGIEVSRALVTTLIGPRIESILATEYRGDFKTSYQEIVARNLGVLPEYRTTSKGPDHQKHFKTTVFVSGEPRGSGEGRSKKEAEQAAARDALDGEEGR